MLDILINTGWAKNKPHILKFCYVSNAKYVRKQWHFDIFTNNSNYFEETDCLYFLFYSILAKTIVIQNP